MGTRFTVNDASRCLEVEINQKRHFLIRPYFREGNNHEKALQYLRCVASRLNELLSAGRIREVANLLKQADQQVQQAEWTELLMGPVKFPDMQH
jgi:hypothetical protein